MSDVQFCSNCGNKNSADSAFCSKCGSKTKNTNSANMPPIINEHNLSSPAGEKPIATPQNNQVNTNQITDGLMDNAKKIYTQGVELIQAILLTLLLSWAISYFLEIEISTVILIFLIPVAVTFVIAATITVSNLNKPDSGKSIAMWNAFIANFKKIYSKVNTVAGVCLVVFLVGWYYIYGTIHPIKETVTASQLAQEYHNDVSKANQKYNQKAIEVNGRVVEKGQFDNSKNIYVRLATPSKYEDIEILAAFASDDIAEVNRVNPGDFVLVKGADTQTVKQDNPDTISIQFRGKNIQKSDSRNEPADNEPVVADNMNKNVNKNQTLNSDIIYGKWHGSDQYDIKFSIDFTVNKDKTSVIGQLHSVWGNGRKIDTGSIRGDWTGQPSFSVSWVSDFGGRGDAIISIIDKNTIKWKLEENSIRGEYYLPKMVELKRQ